MYAANFCYIGILSTWMHRYVTNPRRHLIEGMSPEAARYYAFKAIIISIIFGLIIVISFFNTMLALLIPPLTPLFVFILARIYKARQKKAIR